MIEISSLSKLNLYNFNITTLYCNLRIHICRIIDQILEPLFNTHILENVKRNYDEKTKCPSTISKPQNASNNMLPVSSIDPKPQISFINPLHENYVSFSPTNAIQNHIPENKCNWSIKSKYFDTKRSPTSKTYEYNYHNKNIMSHTESESSNETTNKLERTTILPAF